MNSYMGWKEYERKIGNYFREKGYNVRENRRIKGKSGVEFHTYPVK